MNFRSRMITKLLTFSQVILLALMFSSPLQAVDCSSTNISLGTQADVDNFQATYGGGGICDTVAGGELVIGGTNITNLDGLTDLIEVQGDFYIAFTSSLTDIDGLLNITRIGNLHLESNEALANLYGLSNLSIIDEGLTIAKNATLTNLSGLTSLVSAQNIVIDQNPVLADIDGLANLTSVKYLLFAENTSLSNIDGLANLTSLDEIFINNLPSLTNIDGLANLTSVNVVSISDNTSLDNIDGLANLSSAGRLGIEGNTSLTDIDGLAKLTIVSWGDLWITDNDSLTNIDGLANLTSAGMLGIQHNASLTNIDGLAKLTNVHQGGLSIYNNDSLTNIDGLVNLSSVGGNLSVSHNDQLGICSAIAPLLGWPSGPPEDSVAGDITFNSNAFGCNSVEEILASVKGPDAPVITSVIGGSQQLTLEFLEATTPDSLYPILSYEANCVGAWAESIFDPESAESIPDSGSISKQLTIKNFGPISGLQKIEVFVDITHERTRHLVLTLVSPEGTELVLWDRGVGTGSDLVGTFPTTLTPVDDLSAIADENLNGIWTLRIADVVAGFEGMLNSWGIRALEDAEESGLGSPLTINDLSNHQGYACTVSPVTGLGIFPESNEMSATPPIGLFNIDIEQRGAWYFPATSGQGQLIDIDPINQFLFLSWFSFTDEASGSPNEQHWYTAQGYYDGNEAVLQLYETLGGEFDDSQSVVTTEVGEVVLSFFDCGHGSMHYRFFNDPRQGNFPVLRAIPGSEDYCEQQSAATTESTNINDGMDGAWYDRGSAGQGFLIDVSAGSNGDKFMFVAWFTYGSDTESGQRWLTAQGNFEGSVAKLDLYETTGGSFDNPEPVGTTKVGNIKVDFVDCENAVLDYSLPNETLEGQIEIVRAVPNSQGQCQDLSRSQ